MRKITTRVFSLVLALVMCFGIVTVGAQTVSAAELPTVTVTPLVTDSVNKQAFQVTSSVNAVYEARYDGGTYTGDITASTQTVEFNTSDEVKFAVYAPYLDDDNDEQYHTVRVTSINAYYVYVIYKSENGEFDRDRIKLSKHNEPQVVYNAPAVIDNGTTEYRAANPSVLFNYGDTNKDILYTTVTKGAKTATIKYVDDQDTVIFTDTKVLNYGDTAEITAPATYTVDGNTYALKTTGSYSVTYENVQGTYTFEYAKQAPAAQLPYNITVNLVDENGTRLNTITASVDVGKQATVTLPATYEVGLKKYALADGQATSIVRDYASTEPKTYNVTYKLVGETAAYTVTVNFVDQATDKVLGTVSGTVEPDGTPFTYDISSKNSIVKDGVTYWVLSGQGNSKGKIVHAYNDGAKSYNLYYSAKREGVLESYDVSMRYICVNDNAVLATETKNVKVNSSVTFEEAPSTLTVNGKEYVRLNGQSGTTVHKYNDAQTAYEIYYRDTSVSEDKNDIIYVPGETTPETPDNKVEDDSTTKPTTPGGATTPTTPESSTSNKVEGGSTTKPTTPSGTTTGTTTPTAPETSTPAEKVEDTDTTQPTTPDSESTGTTTTPDTTDTTVTRPGTTTQTGTTVTTPVTRPEDDAEATEEPEQGEAELPEASEVETEEESSGTNEEVEIIEEDDVPLADAPVVDAAAEETSSAVPYVFGGIGLVAIIVLAIIVAKKRRNA